MNSAEVFRELKALGTEQNRKTYRRHGVGENLYGVSYANLGKLKKKIGIDQELAQKLWESDNHDAQVLATMIANPAAMGEGLLEAWALGLTNYVLTDALAGLASQTPFARKKMEQWTRSGEEWIESAGWGILARLAAQDKDLTDEYLEQYLAVIERDIHSSKNRVRHVMNSALIGIGIRNGQLEKKALAVAGKICKVMVDHGDTGCKTPDAAEYIRKVLKRGQGRHTAAAQG